MHSSPVALAGDAAWQATDLRANIRDLAFNGTDDGWAVGVGDGGWVFATTDGGRSWLRRSVPHPGIGLGDDLESIDFADARHGWIVGGDLILATSDGGAHWEVQHSPVNGLSDVSLGDARHGWILTGSGILLATTDGGATWNRRHLFTTDGVWAIDFVGSEDGWGVADGNIQATTDAGASWHRQTLPRVPRGWVLDLSTVAFTTRRSGWVVGAMVEPNVFPIPERLAVLHTTDGGANWRLEDTPRLRGSLSAVSFADPVHGWAVGIVADNGKTAGVVLATDDGGMTWHEQVRGPAGNDFKAVAFSDARHGCVAGGQLVLTTASGGKS